MIKGLIEANKSLVEQCIHSFLEIVPQEIYADISLQPYPFSLGAQVRHNLDMYACLLRDFDSGIIDFPNREANTEYETNIPKTISYARRMQTGLDILVEQDIRTPLLSRVEPDMNMFVDIPMTLGGVLGLLFYHTMHHHAIMAIMSEGLGFSIPDKTFGYNPTSIRKMDPKIREQIFDSDMC